MIVIGFCITYFSDLAQILAHVMCLEISRGNILVM